MQDTDAQLHLKKRARRRLVGAVAFVALVTVALPMLMDQEPKPPVQDVEIRIPGQDEKPFTPKFAAAPAGKAPEKLEIPADPLGKAAGVAENKSGKLAETTAVAKADKPAPAEKAAAKDSSGEAKEAAASPAGKASAPAAKGGEQVILIGAFANEANVRNLRDKLGELGIKTYTEPLDSPQGRKTRVRAGPFPNREAADKALDKMKRIGLSGVVAAR